MTKLERYEKGLRNKNWRHFGMTRAGRMSWADWFYMSRLERKAA